MEPTHEIHVSTSTVLDNSHYDSETLVSTNAPTVQPIFARINSLQASNSPVPPFTPSTRGRLMNEVTPCASRRTSNTRNRTCTWAFIIENTHTVLNTQTRPIQCAAKTQKHTMPKFLFISIFKLMKNSKSESFETTEIATIIRFQDLSVTVELSACYLTSGYSRIA
jgi:hypothetical protein